jgi:phospholipid/cholesterol/gamma-HCH transport system substrate-binding protein
MEVDFNKREKIVGVFIIGVTILLLTTVVIIGRGKDWFKKYIPYYTTFEESYNLQVNSPVKLLDANIGKVKKIAIVGDKVRVNLAILEEYKSRIRTNSVATVKSPTIIGTEYIYIIPGTEDAPLIQRGSEIPSKAKKSITDYLDEFQVEKTIKMVVDAVQNISKIVQTLHDPQGPLFTTFDRTNRTLANIKGTVGGLLKTRDLLDQIHRNLDKVENNLAILEKIENGVLENIPDIKKIVKDLTKSVEEIKIIVANIKKGSYDIPKVTQSANDGIYEIRSAVENIDKVVQSIQKNFLIKPNLPPESEPVNVDSGLRP